MTWVELNWHWYGTSIIIRLHVQLSYWLQQRPAHYKYFHLIYASDFQNFFLQFTLTMPIENINHVIITKYTQSNESMLPRSFYLKILQFVKMKARKINNFNSIQQTWGRSNIFPVSSSFKLKLFDKGCDLVVRFDETLTRSTVDSRQTNWNRIGRFIS